MEILEGCRHPDGAVGYNSFKGNISCNACGELIYDEVVAEGVEVYIMDESGTVWRARESDYMNGVQEWRQV